MVLRIMRESQPEDVHFDQPVKERVQECVAAFVLHVTEEACEKCEREGRKAITGDDILWSVEWLGFAGYAAPLRTFLRKHRSIECEDRMRKRRAAEGRGEGDGSP